MANDDTFTKVAWLLSRDPSRQLRRAETNRRSNEAKLKGSLPGVANLFNKQGIDLTISHVPTGFQVAFPAFLDLMSDAFTCDWDEEAVFGRMDSIPTFRTTRRTLSLAWHVPAESFENALENVEKVNKLITFLYPLYDKTGNLPGQKAVGGATAINQSPLVRVSFGNLIQNAVDGRGLLGFLSGITFDPALEYGMFTRKGTNAVSARGGRPMPYRRAQIDNSLQMMQRHSGGASNAADQGVGQEYYPKTFRLNFELTVLHEHELGFKHLKNLDGEYQHLDRDVNFQNFPYASPRGAGLRQTPQDPNLIKVRNRKLTVDPGLPENIQPVDLSQTYEGEAAAVLEQAAKDKPNKDREELNDMMGDAYAGF